MARVASAHSIQKSIGVVPACRGSESVGVSAGHERRAPVCAAVLCLDDRGNATLHDTACIPEGSDDGIVAERRAQLPDLLVEKSHESSTGRLLPTPIDPLPRAPRRVELEQPIDAR